VDQLPSDEEIARNRRLLHTAVEHPVRQDILRRLKVKGATLTAADLESEDLSPRCAGYHLTQLEKVGAIEVAETMHVRGQVIRVYRATPAGHELAPA